jgi:hypothetical protein
MQLTLGHPGERVSEGLKAHTQHFSATETPPYDIIIALLKYFPKDSLVIIASRHLRYGLLMIAARCLHIPVNLIHIPLNVMLFPGNLGAKVSRKVREQANLTVLSTAIKLQSP